jgi:hypothetical protein
VEGAVHIGGRARHLLTETPDQDGQSRQGQGSQDAAREAARSGQ